MSGLLSGLGKFGLGSLSDLKLYDNHEEAKDEEVKSEPAEPVYNEEEFLFDKTYTCPVCDHKYTERTLRTGKVRLVGIDVDLRPRHEQMDVGKYDVISCPRCGYTVLSRFFAPLTPTATKLVKENIAASFVSRTERPAVYSYEIAFERYQLCLANAIVKRAKDSEKAYICLKTGWLLRGMAEHLDKTAEDYQERLKEIGKQEQEYLRYAYDGFIKARSQESYPMCGMDETTLDYLLAALAIGFEEFDTAARMIGGILASSVANSRMKDKARDLRELLREKRS